MQPSALQVIGQGIVNGVSSIFYILDGIGVFHFADNLETPLTVVGFGIAAVAGIAEHGGTVNTIATAVGEDAGTIEEVYEPFLIMKGLIKRTKQGRVATELAYKHLDMPYQSSFI